VFSFSRSLVHSALDHAQLPRSLTVDALTRPDLTADPDERIDLSNRPEHAKRISAMTTALAAEQQRLGDPVPLTVVTPRSAAWSPPR
jgi:hypothetical protein